MYPTLDRLDREWGEIATSPAASDALRRWAATEPALGEHRDLADLLATRKAHPHTAPGILAALARRAAVDPLAARTLLQAVLPGLVRAASTTFAGEAGAIDDLVALAWERIRTYPPTRAGSVAANVVWDVRKRYRAEHHPSSPPLCDVAVEDLPAAGGPEDEVLQRAAVEEVVGAHRRGVIGDVALRLILATRVGGVPIEVAAAGERATPRQATCVRWRAEQRLRPLLAGVS